MDADEIDLFIQYLVDKDNTYEVDKRIRDLSPDSLEYTSWHEYFGKAVLFPLCNFPTVLRRISMKELSELVETPLGENISCLEYEDERSRSMSDDQVMLYLFEEFGISDGQQLQRLDKEQRNAILSALLSRRAGIRQLQRLTGIGKNIISNISKNILKQSGQ